MNTKSMNVADLRQRGFVNVSYPADLRTAVSQAVLSWKAFCALPTDIKLALPYSNKSAGVGYEMKDGVGKNADRKENFDLTLGGKAWLETNALRTDNLSARQFVHDASSLIELVKPTVMEFARQVEAEYGLKDFEQEVKDSEMSFFVRFIHYFGNREVGEETASAHVDQSGFTLHLFESSPGLQCLVTTPDRFWPDWENMPVSEGETAIIPCMQLQLRSEGCIKATPHRVIATEETAKKDGDRLSAVLFVQLGRTLKYDKDKHGRLQEKTPGFNFVLNNDKFKTLFKA